MQYQYTQQYHSFNSAITNAFYNAFHYPDNFDLNKSLAEINAGIFNDRTRFYSSYYRDNYNPLQLYYAVDSARQAIDINNCLSFFVQDYLTKLGKYSHQQLIAEKIINNLKLLLYHTAIDQNSSVVRNGLGNIFFYDYSDSSHKNITSAQLENYTKFTTYSRAQDYQNEPTYQEVDKDRPPLVISTGPKNKRFTTTGPKSVSIAKSSISIPDLHTSTGRRSGYYEPKTTFAKPAAKISSKTSASV